MVTTVPFAGQCQRFTGAFPLFAALLWRFFRFLADALLWPPALGEAELAALAESSARLDVPEGAGAGAEALAEAAEESVGAVCESVLGGLVRRSFCPGYIVYGSPIAFHTASCL